MPVATASAFRSAARRFGPPGGHLAQWWSDPAGFVRRFVRFEAGEGLTTYQDEVLSAIPAHGRVSARALHGAGKTSTAAWAVLWFACTREAGAVPWKVPTTAGAWRQLERYLWPEVHRWARALDLKALGLPRWRLGRELMDLSLSLSHGEAFALASSDPANLEGAHAPQLLYVLDEAKAIAEPTWNAVEGAFSTAGTDTTDQAFALAISTPGAPVGRFHAIHSRKPGTEDWWVRHIRLDEAIAAGRVSRQWAEARARLWGLGSAVYANRVLGEFAVDEGDGVVPLAWAEAAIERWRAWDEAGRPGEVDALGVDVARSGTDLTVIAECVGDVVAALRVTSREDTMATTGRVSGVMAASPVRRAVVDVIGIGAGVVDRLREQGYGAAVVAFNASAGSARKDRSGELGFANARAAAWWGVREALDPAYGPTLALPPDDELLGELCAPTWRIVSTGGGRIQVEAKDEVTRRLGRSPDKADAVVQSQWVPEGELAVPVHVPRHRPQRSGWAA